MTASHEVSKITTRYAVITYRPKWISQEIGYAQARSFAGYFASPEKVREHASLKAGVDGWKNELSVLQVPLSKKTVPDGEEVTRLADTSKMLNGYLMVEVEVFSENGVYGRLLGPRIKIEKS